MMLDKCQFVLDKRKKIQWNDYWEEIAVFKSKKLILKVTIFFGRNGTMKYANNMIFKWIS